MNICSFIYSVRKLGGYLTISTQQDDFLGGYLTRLVQKRMVGGEKERKERETNSGTRKSEIQIRMFTEELQFFRKKML